MADAPAHDSQHAFAHLKRIEVQARDAAANSLAFERSSGALEAATRKAAKITEREIGTIHSQVEEMVASGQAPPVACKMGCWYCCTQLVSTTVPEILRIADHIRASWSAEEQAALMGRIDSFMAASEPFRKGETQAVPRHVCPLLQNQACSVWTVRPLICRGWNSVDVDACIRKKDDPVNDPGVPLIPGQLFVTQYTRTGLRQALEGTNLDSALHELVGGLKIALEIPDAGERYLRGEPVFQPAKVPQEWLSRYG